MKIKWFWMMCMIVMTSLVTVSCGDDDDEGGSGNAPEGTITVNLTSNSGSAAIDFKGSYGGIIWDSATNNLENRYSGGIASLGEKNGLGSIDTNKITESGWANKVACKPGYAYIIKYIYNYNGVQEERYTGIYVVRNITSTSGGIMGVEIQYCTFVPGKGWNQ